MKKRTMVIAFLVGSTGVLQTQKAYGGAVTSFSATDGYNTTISDKVVIDTRIGINGYSSGDFNVNIFKGTKGGIEGGIGFSGHSNGSTYGMESMYNWVRAVNKINDHWGMGLMFGGNFLTKGSYSVGTTGIVSYTHSFGEIVLNIGGGSTNTDVSQLSANLNTTIPLPAGWSFYEEQFINSLSTYEGCNLPYGLCDDITDAKPRKEVSKVYTGGVRASITTPVLFSFMTCDLNIAALYDGSIWLSNINLGTTMSF